ncbi:DJ-1/PfpI family protein [Enterococcus ureilyticus]|uniref:DJ-1/PfpI family protein n=1 Tax=Enterococcus ureilyticus TaxID=1131292 RepID=A0A1E5HEG3_9ENTE|nr:type 1 glutamine amidotransferase family protein [Enterococcus ureilyticus]MBM7689790.1 putative intracellular protease/amidase [Enterococcus ureilyticus]OEG23195.1 DJ-1/PfpI family protein [Enterococcus ureilyticus]
MTEVFFVLLEDYADWEAASIAAALNQQEGFTVKTVSNEKQAIHSMGGFSILPDYTLTEACQKEFVALILIGGTSWRTDKAKEVDALVAKAEQQGAVIAAICDATVYLGSLGLLNDHKHTSNQLQDLQDYAGARYTGGNHYLEVQAIRANNLITANGTGHLEFAREILLALQVMPEKEVEQWYNFYKLGYYEAIKQELRNAGEDRVG